MKHTQTIVLFPSSFKFINHPRWAIHSNRLLANQSKNQGCLYLISKAGVLHSSSTKEFLRHTFFKNIRAQTHPQSSWLNCSEWSLENHSFSTAARCLPWCSRIEEHWTWTSNLFCSTPLWCHTGGDSPTWWISSKRGKGKDRLHSETHARKTRAQGPGWLAWPMKMVCLQLFEGLFCEEGLGLFYMVWKCQFLWIRGSSQIWPKVASSQSLEEFRKTVHDHLMRLERGGGGSSIE